MQGRFRRAPLVGLLAMGLALGGAVNLRAQENGADQTGYFLGENRSDSADGRGDGASVVLLKRVLSPLRGTIEEQVITAGRGGAGNEVVWIYRVLGSQVLVETKGSPTKGEGELIGKPWQWSSMRFTIRLPGKEGTVRGERRYSRDSITGNKTAYDIQGRARGTYEEAFRPISRDMYEILRARLISK